MPSKSLKDRQALPKHTTRLQQAPASAQLPFRSRINRRPDSTAFRTHELPSLQRQLGNRQVRQMLGRLSRRYKSDPPIQRALPDGATYQALDLGDARLIAVGDAVVAYNAIADQRGSAEQFQQCFNRLQAVDRAIYRWFAQVTATNQRLEGNPHTPTVKALMSASEREHEDLIQASKNLVDVLPFDTTGMDQEDLEDLRTLWQDIVNNRGKIKLVGSVDYNKRVLAELGKMLGTPTGRSMLQFLNTPKPTEVPNSPEAALTNIYIGETVSQLPEEVRTASPELQDQHRSEAQPLNVGGGRKLEDMTEVTETDIVEGDEPDPVQFPAVTPDTKSRVREAAWGGLSGFTHGGKKYTFNQRGTGAFVTSIPGVSVQPGKGAGNEILSPGWVTLGHELGHAANMRAGSSTMGMKSFFDHPLVTGLAGGVQAGKKWDNAEELLNIENVENALRQDSGLTEREGHQPPVWAQGIAVQVRADLRRPLQDLYNDDNTWYQDPEWQDLDRRCRTIKIVDVLDPVKVQALRNEVANFLPSKVNALLPGYLRRISKDQAKADALMNVLPDMPTKILALRYLHKHVGQFDTIKERLHFGFWKRLGTKKAARAQSRTTTLLDLINGRVQL